MNPKILCSHEEGITPKSCVYYHPFLVSEVGSKAFFYGVQILSYHGMCVCFVKVRAACLNKTRTLIDNSQ